MFKDKRPVKLLVIEDNSSDFALIQDYITDQFANSHITQAKSFAKAKTLLTSGTWKMNKVTVGGVNKNDIFPGFLATAYDRMNMVEGKLPLGEALIAILASVIVPRVNIRAREADGRKLPFQVDPSAQLDDGGNLELTAHGMNRSAVLL